MPVVKIIPFKSNPARLEAYIKNPQKTKESLYFGNLCDFEHVARSFSLWNQKLHKPQLPTSRTYYHIIISWNTGKDRISPEQCRRMSEEICRKCGLSGYPYFGTIHTDKKHLHAHIIVNNCSVYGKSYQSTRESTRALKKTANEICQREGYLHSVTEPDGKAADRLTDAEAQMILSRNELPWKEKLRHQLDEAVNAAGSKEEFIRILQSRFQIQVSESRKGELRFLPPEFRQGREGAKVRPCPARRLGDRYSMSNLEKLFAQNRRKKAAHTRKGGPRR